MVLPLFLILVFDRGWPIILQLPTTLAHADAPLSKRRSPSTPAEVKEEGCFHSISLSEQVVAGDAEARNLYYSYYWQANTRNSSPVSHRRRTGWCGRESWPWVQLGTWISRAPRDTGRPTKKAR